MPGWAHGGFYKPIAVRMSTSNLSQFLLFGMINLGELPVTNDYPGLSGG